MILFATQILIFFLLAIFALLTWRNLETGLLLLCALLPSYLTRFTIAGVPTTFLEMMTLIVLIVWIFKKIKSRSLPSLNHPITLPLCLLLLAATLGIIVSPDKHAAIGVWKAFYVEPILMFFILVDTVGTHKGHPYEIVSTIFRALGISALLVSLFGLIQYFFSIGIPAPWDLEHRITSVFDYPNALALFLEPIIVISWFQIAPLIQVMDGVPRPRRISKELLFWTLVSTLATINVFLAQSEAGIAALVVTAICILLFSKNTRQQTLASILIVSALVFSIPSTRHYLVEKFTFSDSSEHVRLSQWKETFELLKDHSVFGTGLSGYPIVMKQYHHDLQYEIFQYPHNILLNIWVELGLLGLIAFFLLAFQLFRHRLSNLSDLSDISNLFPFLFLEIFLHGLVDVPYFKNDLAMMVWILIACMSAVRSNKSSHTSYAPLRPHH